jgi:predicted transcriptional regulator
MPNEGSETPLDRIRFVARAESRIRLIEHLLESGATTQRELRTRLEASRTTISRSLGSLADCGLVEETDGAYRLTHAGRLFAAEFTRLLDRVRRLEELSEFLRWFPDGVEPPDVLDADDLEVTYSTDAAPYAPARKQTEILHTAERLRVLLPAIDLESTRAITEQVTQRGLEVETIVSPDVEATVESEEFAPLIREKVRTDRSAMFVARTDLPFYLGLADDGRVQIGLADAEGLPRALLETTDDGIRTWAEEVYGEYREEARRKSIEEL